MGSIKFDKKSVGRMISVIEAGGEDFSGLMDSLYKSTGNAYRIGITGPPGAGKSTITNQLTKYFRLQNRTVGIIAVDPTSPFTGGALLGDRIRMNDLSGDDGVFIRSMATRGSLGGLARMTTDAADILDAAGFDLILLETVGVGQSELEIASAVDTTVVVLVPESGDSVQAMKAGLMEIADIFVLNKSDRPGADSAINSVKTILQFRSPRKDSWNPAIVKCTATENSGITEIAGEIARHRNYLTESGEFLKRRRKNLRIRIKMIVHEKITEELWKGERTDSLNFLLEQKTEGKESPYRIADIIIGNYKNK